MSQSETAVLAYWSEHRDQLRQSETQRALLTNYLLVIAAALSALVVQQRFVAETLLGIAAYGLTLLIITLAR